MRSSYQQSARSTTAEILVAASLNLSNAWRVFVSETVHSQKSTQSAAPERRR
jgi:hypothetical protein